MVKKVCVDCLKVFVNKSNLNRHTETAHSSHVQPTVDEFDDPTQSGVLYSDDAVQSTTQDDDRSMTDSEASVSDGNYGSSEPSDSGEFDTPEQSGGAKFENDDNQVGVASQDHDRSMIVNAGSDSESDDSIQHSDSDPSGDGESCKLLGWIYSF